MGMGYLRFSVTTAEEALAVQGARVFITGAGGMAVWQGVTDAGGQTPSVPLSAPDSMGDQTPGGGPYYAVYDVEAQADGFAVAIRRGVQIFDTIGSVLPVTLLPAVQGRATTDEIDIPPIAVDTDSQSGREAPDDGWGGRVQPDVFVPEFITVHLGSYLDKTASNVRVPFLDYIKNVASSEIYPDWPEQALRANILCHISFALNRVYTEWYRSRGYSFDITNNTAQDQAFVYGRNIFDSVARIAEQIFDNYVRREGYKEPYFTEYCNGTTVKCAGLSQFGSADLARQGYSYMQILKYYYPKDLEQVVAPIKALTDSYPGSPLVNGSSGDDVRRMQMYLNRIHTNFPNIPLITKVDGVYGAETEAAVREFQKTFGLTADGKTGKATWYEISRVYSAVKKLSELGGEGETAGVGSAPPTTTARPGDRFGDVPLLQFLLNDLAAYYPDLPAVLETSVFDGRTEEAVKAFQRKFGLTADGIVGRATWQALYDEYKAIHDNPAANPPGGGGGTGGGGAGSLPPYPGTALRIGSSGANVTQIQTCLNNIGKRIPGIPALATDGKFGNGTNNAVVAFQKAFGLEQDGVVGAKTWAKIMEECYKTSGGEIPPYPGYAMRVGVEGEDVRLMQTYLNALSKIYPSIPSLTPDGAFGNKTKQAVMAFQNVFGLPEDGVIGPTTWNAIANAYNQMGRTASFATGYAPYPNPSNNAPGTPIYGRPYTGDYVNMRDPAAQAAMPSTAQAAMPTAMPNLMAMMMLSRMMYPPRLRRF